MMILGSQSRRAGSRGGKGGRRPRETAVLVACNRCRRAKTRCDNVRPSCSACQRAGVPCHFDTDVPEETRAQAVRRQHRGLQDVHRAARQSLGWLSAQSSDIILTCLQQLQYADDPLEELCSLVAAERALRRPPDIPGHETLIAASEQINDSLTAELVMRHPAAFPWLPESRSTPSPVPCKDSFRASLSNPLRPPREQLLHEAHASRLRAHVDDSPPQAGTCRARLYQLDIKFWTIVPISNQLAASILSSYLSVEHPIYGFFDADLFLDDLLDRNLRFCSPLLVNALLFWASCTYGPLVLGASAFVKIAKAFLDTAHHLFQGDRDNDAGLNVASLMILAIGSICFGADKAAKEYMVAGIEMAERLSLIGEQRRSSKGFDGLSRDSLSMLSHVAWGAFNFSTVYLMHFHDVESATFTRCPPLLPKPLPRSVSIETCDKNMGPSPARSLAGATFPYFCDFWSIAHEIGSVFYSSPGPIHQHVPLAFAESKFQRLLEWARGLPPEAARSKNMSHAVAEMHICYHATIMDLFRPFLAQGQQLSSFSTSPRRPEAIFGLSLAHLRALSRYYYTSYAGLPESHSISWVHGPLYVAPAILHYDRSEGWEAEFLFFLEACSDLLLSHPALEGFLRALLAMGISCEAVTLKQAIQYLDNLGTLREDGDSVGIPETGFVVDQDLAVEDRDASIGDAVAQRLDELLFTEDPLDPGYPGFESTL